MAKASFNPGDAVFHPRLGRGRIIEEWGAWADAGDGSKLIALSGGGVFDVEFQTHGRRSVSSCPTEANRFCRRIDHASSGGIKVNLDTSDPIEICGRT
jgi:hypothetical protein